MGFVANFDKLVKSPKFRHACEGRYPELFENTGFPPLPSLGQALRGNDAKGRFKAFYETIKFKLLSKRDTDKHGLHRLLFDFACTVENKLYGFCAPING